MHYVRHGLKPAFYVIDVVDMHYVEKVDVVDMHYIDAGKMSVVFILAGSKDLTFFT